MTFSATPANAVETTSDENSIVISYTYENGVVEALLSVNGSVCIGGFEATLNYNKGTNKVKEKKAINSNILINDIPSNGELAISMAANNNLTDESELFKISFESDDVPNKSDFSFEISDMYMFNGSLDFDSVSYTINEEWSGFEETTSTTTSSVAIVSTTMSTTTTEPISTNHVDSNAVNQFIVSVQENEESNAVEVSLSVKGNVEFWTAEGSIKLDMSGYGAPTLLNAIPDALTSYKEDTSNIFFTVVSASGQNIINEQTIFTYSFPISSSTHSITCVPKISDICNADYNDVKYILIVDDRKEPISTTSTTSTNISTTTTEKLTTSSTTSTSSSTTTSTKSTITSSTETTSTTHFSTINSTTTESVTTTEETTVYVSPYEMSNWAKNDYFKKTGVEPYTSTYTENDDGTLSITLLDEDGNVLDKYTVHSRTGIGFNSSGEEVNLPQTGNNSMKNWLIVFGALMLIGLGSVSIKTSRVSFRGKDEQ